jgi:hypothetical protein
VIDFVTDSDGSVIEVEERVGVAAPVLEQAASIWERLLLSAMEACADHAAFCPMTESDHRGALEAQGHPAEVLADAFRNLRHIGLLRRERSTKLAETSSGPHMSGGGRQVVILWRRTSKDHLPGGV